MENSEKAKSYIIKKYEELQSYSTAYNKKASTQKDKLMNTYKAEFKANPNSVDLTEVARDMFYINGFHQADIRKLQVQLLDSYILVKEIFPEVEFSKDIETTLVILKGNLQKQIFIEDEGEFEEIEKGKLDTLKKDFKDRNYFKMFEAQVKKLFND